VTPKYQQGFKKLNQKIEITDQAYLLKLSDSMLSTTLNPTNNSNAGNYVLVVGQLTRNFKPEFLTHLNPA